MKRHILFALALIATSANADRGIWRMHDHDGVVTDPDGTVRSIDQQQGVSCDGFNRMAGFSWVNKGGDWTDSAGTPQGTIPFASVSVAVVPNTTPVQKSLDVTNMIGASTEGFIIRRTNNAVMKMAMREHATMYPTLEVTTPGGLVVLQATADTSMQFVQLNPPVCATTANQKSTISSINPNVVIQFPEWPADATAATLKIWVTENGSSSSLQVFKLSVPRVETPQTNYVAKNPNAQIIWQEDFNATMPTWWANLGYNANWTAPTWLQDGGFGFKPNMSGMWRANGDTTPVLVQGTTNVYVPRGKGWNNTNGLMEVINPTTSVPPGYGVEMKNVSITGLTGSEQPEVWLRYMVKFDPSWYGFAKGEGGKLPGLSGNVQYCANTGVPASGYCGWSTRLGYEMPMDQTNPAFEYIRPVTYTYTTEATGSNGQHWYGDYRSLIKRGEWACIIQHTKVNTPGVADGINQIYIKHEADTAPILVHDKRNVYVRGPNPATVFNDPAQGYGQWMYTNNAAGIAMPNGALSFTDPVNGRTIFKWGNGVIPNSTLGIDKLFWVQHTGGLTPPNKVAQVWFDEFVMAYDNPGCPTSPPSAESLALQASVAAYASNSAAPLATATAMQASVATYRAQATALQADAGASQTALATVIADGATLQAQITSLLATYAGNPEAQASIDVLNAALSSLATTQATVSASKSGVDGTKALLDAFAP